MNSIRRHFQGNSIGISEVEGVVVGAIFGEIFWGNGGFCSEGLDEFVGFVYLLTGFYFQTQVIEAGIPDELFIICIGVVLDPDSVFTGFVRSTLAPLTRDFMIDSEAEREQEFVVESARSFPIAHA